MSTHTRTETIEGSNLYRAPENEMGVVFLFAELAKRWRLRIDEIRSQFPDCIAYQKIQGREKRIWIEFEYRSKNFVLHGHDPKKCDWIVCWEHNWTDVPNRLHVIELRREFGLGFNIWIVPVVDKWKDAVRDHERLDPWIAPAQAHQDDLILFYFTGPDDMSIPYVYQLTDRVAKRRRRGKMSTFSSMSRVCDLKGPIFYDDLKTDRILSTASFVRSQMQGRNHCATEYWPYLYDMILRRNPKLRKKLAKYAPDRIEAKGRV